MNILNVSLVGVVGKGAFRIGHEVVIVARVVVGLDDFREVTVAARADEAVFVAIPFILALMAVDQVARAVHVDGSGRGVHYLLLLR